MLGDSRGLTVVLNMGEISKTFNYNINSPKITHVLLSKKMGYFNSLPDFHMIETEFYVYQKSSFFF